MAERPTKRERREQARRNKIEEQRRRARRRRRQRIVTLLSFVAIAALIAGLFYISGQAERNRTQKLNTLASEAGCTPVQTHPDELASGTTHAAPPAKVEYKTNPPTSGNHYGVSPRTGVFGAPREPEEWVHSLEHGHTGVLYKETLDPAIKAELEKRVLARDTLTFMQPRPQNEEELVFVAWTKSVRCANPTDAQKVGELAEAIFEAKLGKGAPEFEIPGSPANENTGNTPPQPTASATGSPTS